MGDMMQARLEGGYRLYLNKGNNAAIPVSFNGTPGTFNANMLERNSGAGRVGVSLWGTDGGYLFGEVGYHGHYSRHAQPRARCAVWNKDLRISLGELRGEVGVRRLLSGPYPILCRP